MCEMENTLDRINGKLDFVEEKVNEPEDGTIETIPKKRNQKEKRNLLK